MIDVHIGHMPDDNPHRWKQCEESSKDRSNGVHHLLFSRWYKYSL